MTPAAPWTGGAPESFVLRSGRVVDPREGLDDIVDVRISDGRIQSIGAAGESPADSGVTELDCTGLILTPALTDPHVHFRTPGQEHKETISTGTAAAAAGGYCLVIAMPNTAPVIDTPDMVRSVLARAATEAVVPMAQMGAITTGLNGESLTEMAEMADVGAAGFTDDGIPVADAGVLRRALRYQELAGLTIALHEEDPALSLGAPMNEGLVSARLGLRGQPGEAESTMIARDVQLAALEGAAIHIQHVSTAESVRIIRDAKQRGIRITAEASPHHLLLTDEAVAGLDSRAKMNPPLRSEEDRLAVIEGLTEGTLDCIATDHAPHSVDEKEQPFEDAPFGTTGLETSFAVLYDELVVRGSLSLSTLVERLTAGCIPFGFEPPSVRVGAPADIAVFDPRPQWRIGDGGWASLSSNSVFTGRRVEGRIVRTIVQGVSVYSREEIG